MAVAVWAGWNACAEADPRIYDLNSLLFEPSPLDVRGPAPPPPALPAPIPPPTVFPQPWAAAPPAPPAPSAAPPRRPPDTGRGEVSDFAADLDTWFAARKIKASAGGGANDGEGTVFFRGSVTVPIGTSWGTQADALVGVTGDDPTWGLAGHLFWRDPETGLLGAVTSYSRRQHDPESIGRLGIEGEWYSGRFTTLAHGGIQYGGVDDGPFGRVDLRWYRTDDLMLSGGGEVETGDFVARFGAEYQPGLSGFPGLSVFADAEIGEGSWYRVVAGGRYYFGDPQPLIRRHRVDDPENTLDDQEFALRGGRHGSKKKEEPAG